MKYNNKWAVEQYKKEPAPDFLFFWGHQPGKDGHLSKACFSQWWPSPFEVDGLVYKTAEHWMMAGKARLFNDASTLQQIIEANTPKEAKEKGRLVTGFDPAGWDKEKSKLVIAGNLYKFSAHRNLGKFLLDTGDRIIVEASPVDPVWGIGMAEDNPLIKNPANWKGENLLGYALMEVRDKLKQDASHKL